MKRLPPSDGPRLALFGLNLFSTMVGLGWTFRLAPVYGSVLAQFLWFDVLALGLIGGTAALNLFISARGAFPGLQKPWVIAAATLGIAFVAAALVWVLA